MRRKNTSFPCDFNLLPVLKIRKNSWFWNRGKWSQKSWCGFCVLSLHFEIKVFSIFWILWHLFLQIIMSEIARNYFQLKFDSSKSVAHFRCYMVSQRHCAIFVWLLQRSCRYIVQFLIQKHRIFFILEGPCSSQSDKWFLIYGTRKSKKSLLQKQHSLCFPKLPKTSK